MAIGYVIIPIELLLLVALLSFSACLPALSIDFVVGGSDGWTIPSSNDTDFYNHWAAKNRFKVGDTVSFKYKKDSVMVVSEEEYDKCHSAHPVFFSNNGKTEVRLDRPGLFYFMSGADGHCERGQKMIIKVMGDGTGSAPGGSPPAGGHGSDSDPDSDAAGLISAQLPLYAAVGGSVVLMLLGFD
ncbi:Early nodulin-like protein 1 [Apostasia shenzhenica]|uniref:Early nodulin-like protein 1 n=1 Tax=Apostasia shenzhenica TaxID=1088818 RepID=A0A2I0AUU2_9ASPA|nr:Early nodulin-like protein 1 [Apostasia shenzhenica]